MPLNPTVIQPQEKPPAADATGVGELHESAGRRRLAESQF
jgi:hypothetical protein